MRYKIVITFPEKITAEKMYKVIQNSKIYHSQEIINLHPITEVCDECDKRAK